MGLSTILGAALERVLRFFRGKPNKVPPRTRRLTRAEAQKLGLEYSKRLRVNADNKRITKRTKLYTDYQVRKFKLGMTPQRYAMINKIKKRSYVVEPSSVWFSDLRQLPTNILHDMANSPTREQWHAHARAYTDDNPDDYNNPFWYHD